MHLQQLNARRRERVLLDELARLNQRAQVIEPAPSPASSPAPAPVDGGGDAA